jgi:hypothetical protein
MQSYVWECIARRCFALSRHHAHVRRDIVSAICARTIISFHSIAFAWHIIRQKTVVGVIWKISEILWTTCCKTPMSPFYLRVQYIIFTSSHTGRRKHTTQILANFIYLVLDDKSQLVACYIVTRRAQIAQYLWQVTSAEPQHPLTLQKIIYICSHLAQASMALAR